MPEMTNTEIVDLVESGKIVRVKIEDDKKATAKKYAISQAKSVKYKDYPKELKPDYKLRYIYEKPYLYVSMYSMTAEVESVGW